MQWLAVSKMTKCEICKHTYGFRDTFSDDMPTRLPLADVVRAYSAKVVSFVQPYVVSVALIVLWLVAVPNASVTLLRVKNTTQPYSIAMRRLLLVWESSTWAEDLLFGLVIMIATAVNDLGLHLLFHHGDKVNVARVFFHLYLYLFNFKPINFI